MSTLRSTYVPPETPDLPILFIVEAPDETEERLKRPLIGPSGQLLETACDKLNLVRGKDYGLTNVCKYRPTKNDWAGLAEEVKLAQERQLLTELATYRNINTLICLGATATKAVITMLDTVGNPLTFTKMRGCFWEAKLDNPRTGHLYKALCTYHPAAILHQIGSPLELGEDIAKAIQYNNSPYVEYDHNPSNDRIVQTAADALSWIELLAKQPILVYDVETIPPKWQVDCISFAWSATEGVCFDLLSDDQKSIGGLLERILTNPSIIKCGQNVGYDQDAIQRTFGYYPTGPHLDTLDMHNLLDPGVPHDLGYLSAKFCNRPYFKDEKKQIKGKIHDRLTRLKYCLTDSLTEYAVMEVLAASLDKKGLW